MKHNYNYQVWELNDGGLVLLVYEDGKLVYANSGYEYNRGILTNDMECLASDACNVDEWEENFAPGMTPDEMALITGPTSSLIAEDGTIYPEDMGPNGKAEFLRYDCSFTYHGGREVGQKLKDLEYDMEIMGIPADETLYDVEINGFYAGDMYAGDLVDLINR